MLAKVRRVLAMGARARDFCRANPGDTTGFPEMLDGLTQRLARADALAIQQRNGLYERHAAVVRRTEVRQFIQSQLLTQLVLVGREVEAELPELAGIFRLPFVSVPNKSFLTSALAMNEKAQAARDRFEAHGMPAPMLDMLDSLLAEYQRLTEAAHQSRRDHVGATAELRLLEQQILRAVKKLDGVNSFRLQGSPDLLAAWKSAADVIGPFRRTQDPEAGDDPVPPQGEAVPAA